MKALIYGLYVAAVLLFSAFARAEVSMPFSTILPKQTQVNISDVAFNEGSFELQIEGTLPNKCYPKPFATVVQNSEFPNVLRLRLTSPSPTNPCPSRIEKYSTVVNLPVVVQNARLVLEPGTQYVIEIEGYKYEMQVLGSELLKVPGFVSFQ